MALCAFGQLVDSAGGGYVSGTENIDVATFNVPERLYGKTIRLTLEPGGGYTLAGGGFLFGDKFQLHGHVGQMLHEQTPYGLIELLVQRLDGRPGATFNLSRYSEAGTIEWLQNTVAVLEKGKQSNIIGATLDGTDPKEDSRILNEIGRAYIEQNAQRKSAEADKSIHFLDTQLPVLKAQLEAAETRFNAFRAEHGTLDTSQYGAALLQQSVQDQVKVFDLQQRRERFNVALHRRASRGAGNRPPVAGRAGGACSGAAGHPSVADTRTNGFATTA